MVPMYLDTFAFTLFLLGFIINWPVLLKSLIMKFVFGLLHGVVRRSAVLENDDHEQVLD